MILRPQEQLEAFQGSEAKLQDSGTLPASLVAIVGD
jgi:hypothetical protein